MTYLPDVNVWIALAVDHHSHHSSAKRWEERLGTEQLRFCRITEMGLLRLLTNARVMGGVALSAAEAWNVRDRILSDPRIDVLHEPAGFEAHWRATAGAGKIGPNFWTDAYLVSLCASAEYTLVTFDRTLAGSNGCNVRLLHGH